MNLPDLAQVDMNVVSQNTVLTWHSLEWLLRELEGPITVVSNRKTRRILDDTIRYVPTDMILTPEWSMRLESDPGVPDGTILFLVPRVDDETDAEWARRCGKIVGFDMEYANYSKVV
jgi:hypothetical protein